MKLPDPVQFAVPAFIGLCIVEAIYLRLRGKMENEVRDSAASLSMGIVNLVLSVLTAAFIYGTTEWVYQFRLFEVGYAWWAFALILFAEDFIYYWFHRWSHEVRWLWASHVVHHSSQHYNLTTALRQTWTNFISGTWLLWLPLALLGFPPPLIVFQKGISLVYQFWIHTETIRRMGPVETVMNTPSHHRVHHARNADYLDRNYAGIFIVWDRLFGTYVPEDPSVPCRYGLVRQIATFNPLKIAFHEWVGIARDVFSAPNWKARLRYTFGPPGWSHDGSRKTSEQLRTEYRARRSPAAG